MQLLGQVLGQVTTAYNILAGSTCKQYNYMLEGLPPASSEVGAAEFDALIHGAFAEMIHETPAELLADPVRLAARC